MVGFINEVPPEQKMAELSDPDRVREIFRNGKVEQDKLADIGCNAGICGAKGTVCCPGHAPEVICGNYTPASKNPDEMDELIASALVNPISSG